MRTYYKITANYPDDILTGCIVYGTVVRTILHETIYKCYKATYQQGELGNCDRMPCNYYLFYHDELVPYEVI